MREEGSGCSTRMTRAVKRTRTASVRVTWGGEGQGDFEFGSGLERAVEVEENAPGADILSLGLNLAGWNLSGAGKANNGGKAHVKAPHHPPFL